MDLMNIKTMIISAAVISVIMASGCDKNEDSMFTTQENNIESIVTSLTNSIDTAVVEYFDGTVRVTVAGNGGTALESNGSVTFLYALHYISGSALNSGNLVTTNSEAVATQYRWNITDSTVFQPVTLNLSEDEIVEGLRNGLPGVKTGDECYIMFNGRHGFGKRPLASIPGNSALAYHLWITGVEN